MGFHAIVPAGGAGRRLWPVSTAARPKFLLPLDVAGATADSRGVGSGAAVAGDAPVSRGATWDNATFPHAGAESSTASLGDFREYSLAQNTARRLAPLAASLTWVTGAAHATALQTQIEALSLPIPSRFLVEPEARDSLAAIGLGAAVVEKTYGPAVVGSFAADHHLGNQAAFADALRAAKAAAQAGKLATIGIDPTAPVTGYGYIELGDKTPGNPGWHLVKRFHEKPDATTAKSYLETGGYLWNAGMFVFRTDVFFAALECEAPGAPEALRALAAGGDDLSHEAGLELWRRIPRAPIDTVLAEPLARRGAVAVAPAARNLDWSDIGDWQAVYALHAGIGGGNTGDLTGENPKKNAANPAGNNPNTLSGQSSENAAKPDLPLMNLRPDTPAVTIDAPGALVRAPGLAGVAIVGIPGVVVIEENGQLLVTTREHAQDVKAASLATEQWSQPLQFPQSPPAVGHEPTLKQP